MVCVWGGKGSGEVDGWWRLAKTTHTKKLGKQERAKSLLSPPPKKTETATHPALGKAAGVHALVLVRLALEEVVEDGEAVLGAGGGAVDAPLGLLDWLVVWWLGRGLVVGLAVCCLVVGLAVCCLVVGAGL